MTLTTTVTDYVIWTRHIHGDALSAQTLLGLRAGETVGLKVDGKPGIWRKMDDGKDGRPTPGLRPIGEAQAAWKALYKSRRGDIVPLEVTETPVAVAVSDLAGRLIRTDADRKAAMEALLESFKTPWPSDPDFVFERDAAHER